MTATLDATLTAELGADRFHRAALIREDGHFHSGTTRGVPNTRMHDYLFGPGQTRVPFYGDGDMAITGRVLGHPLGLCGQEEHLPLDPALLAGVRGAGAVLRSADDGAGAGAGPHSPGTGPHSSGDGA